MKHCISIDLMSQEEIIQVIIRALRIIPYYIKNERPPFFEPLEKEGWLPIKVGAIFEEPSSRTLGSLLEAAMRRGFRCGFPFLPSSSSLAKKETPTRAALVALQHQSRLLLFRTKVQGVTLQVAQYLERHKDRFPWWYWETPIINGGDGTQNHPTQVLLDLVAIIIYLLGQEYDGQGIVQLDDSSLIRLEEVLRKMSDSDLEKFIIESLTGKKIAIIGDLRYSRVASSWLDLTNKFDLSFLLVAPSKFQIEELRRDTLGDSVFVTDNLYDALQTDFTIALRAQFERFEKGRERVEAQQTVVDLRIGEEYLKRYKGIVLHPQPLDREWPIIDPLVWNDPKIIMEMQAFGGVSTRTGLIDLCWQGRQEHTSLLQVPEVNPAEILVDKSISAHQREIEIRGKQRQSSVNPIGLGLVLDHVLAGRGGILNLLLERAGVERSFVVPDRDSKKLGRKDILFLDEHFVSYEVLAALALFAPNLTVNEMKEGQFRKMKFKLPEVIPSILICPNNWCVTRIDPESESFFYVLPRGKEVEDVILYCAFCKHYFSLKSILSSVEENPVSQRREFLIAV